MHYYQFAGDDSECESGNGAARDRDNGSSSHDLSIAIRWMDLCLVAAHRWVRAHRYGQPATTMAGGAVRARAGVIRRFATGLRKQRNNATCNVGYSGRHVHGDRFRFLWKRIAVDYSDACSSVVGSQQSV